jgi:hypothetical protein
MDGRARARARVKSRVMTWSISYPSCSDEFFSLEHGVPAPQAAFAVPRFVFAIGRMEVHPEQQC